MKPSYIPNPYDVISYDLSGIYQWQPVSMHPLVLNPIYNNLGDWWSSGTTVWPNPTPVYPPLLIDDQGKCKFCVIFIAILAIFLI